MQLLQEMQMQEEMLLGTMFGVFGKVLD